MLEAYDNGQKVVLFGSEYVAYNDHLSETCWYVADKSLKVSKRSRITGTVNFILCDGVTVDFDEGIEVGTDGKLNIYCQSGGKGTLNAVESDHFDAVIGGNKDKINGIISIYGGNINAIAMH